MAEELRPLLARLSREVRETVNMMVLEYDQALIIQQVVGPETVTVAGVVGQTMPLHATSNGLVLLSTLSDEAMVRLLPPVLPRYGKHTITDRDLLLAEVARVRRTGISVVHEALADGLCTAAVLVTKNVSRPVAISTPVPTHRFHEKEEQLVSALVEIRDQIERRNTHDG
ncbi:MAG: IclR family transcriptional regulator [Thermoleophilia bacterium]